MGSLNVYSLFTNIPLVETIGTCVNSIFSLYKEVDAMNIESPLGPTLGNKFLAFDEKQ